MALPIVHLLVAREWAKNHAEYAGNPEFFLGAISPDAIHIRDKDDKSHKNEIHLNNWLSPHPEDVLAYWRAHDTDFDIGYGIHVLTDGQWVPRFHKRLPGMLHPDGRLDTSIYYNDTNVTDFELYREAGGEALLEIAGQGRAPKDHPLLTEYEIDQWRIGTIAAYHSECTRNDPVRFIDRAYVRAFVEDIIDYLEETFRRFQYERGYSDHPCAQEHARL